MKELIIKFQPFVFKQTVFVKDGSRLKEEQVPQKDLANYISLCEGVHTVHFFGNEKFAKKIKEECITKYQMKPSTINFVYNK